MWQGANELGLLGHSGRKRTKKEEKERKKIERERKKTEREETRRGNGHIHVYQLGTYIPVHDFTHSLKMETQLLIYAFSLMSIQTNLLKHQQL